MSNKHKIMINPFGTLLHKNRWEALNYTLHTLCMLHFKSFLLQDQEMFCLKVLQRWSEQFYIGLELLLSTASGANSRSRTNIFRP